MRYSTYFNLVNKEQKDLDFFNGLINKDTSLFIDPARIELGKDDWFKETSNIIASFFDYIFYLHYEGSFEKARALLDYGKEPNETRLGMSSGKPQGRGTSKETLSKIFRSIEEEGLLDKGLIKDYKDLTIFVEGFDRDRMSDLITNIIRGQLVDYTIEQSLIHDFPLTEEVQEIGKTWNKDKLEWEMVYNQLLLAEGEMLLLVPKNVVVKKYIHSVDNYLGKTVLEWRQKYHKDNETSLARRVPTKDGRRIIIGKPYKKDIREEEIKKRNLKQKEYVIEQSRKNTSLIDNFHRISRIGFNTSWTNKLTDEELEEFTEKEIKKEEQH